jgi:hypothetical protein
MIEKIKELIVLSVGILMIVWGVTFLTDWSKFPANIFGIIIGGFVIWLVPAIWINFHLLDFYRAMGEIQRLAEKLPTGIEDHKALKKLKEELNEISEELQKGDWVAAVMEVGDVTYYCAKATAPQNGLLKPWKAYLYVRYAMFKAGGRINLKMVYKVAINKYTMRSQPGNPKNHALEREESKKIIESFL